METTSTVLQASIGGSLQLLALSGTGAILSHLGHFSSSINTALANAIYKMFLPAFVLIPVLETVDHALNGNAGTLQDIWVPIASAVFILTVTAIVAYPITLLLATGKEEAVRRVFCTCLLLGNWSYLAILVVENICDSFSPLNEDPTCLVRSTGYVSLYSTITTLLTWTIIFPYLCDAPDSQAIPESEPLLPLATTGGSQPQGGTKPTTSFGDLLKRGVLTPPSLAVGLGAALACIPGIPGMFLNEHGSLRPVSLSINQVGSIAVPLSFVIVGAELHRSLTSTFSPEMARATRHSQTFGRIAIAVIAGVRLILLPWLGRFLYRRLEITKLVQDPLLSVFVLAQWNVPTANNCIIMVSLAAERLPVLGPKLREDVSKCLFWQYLALPLFLTFNTTLLLWLPFPDA